MVSERAKRRSEVSAPRPPRFAGAKPLSLTLCEVPQSLNQKDRRDQASAALAWRRLEQSRPRTRTCQQAHKRGAPFLAGKLAQSGLDRGVDSGGCFFLSSDLVARFVWKSA